MVEQSFTFYLGTKIVFGKGSAKLVGEELNSRNHRRTMIVTDKGIINAGLLGGVLESLEQHDINYVIFDEVPPNPPSATVVKGVEFFNYNSCDSLIAVGGGSAMDCCKAIGM